MATSNRALMPTPTPKKSSLFKERNRVDFNADDGIDSAELSDYGDSSINTAAHLLPVANKDTFTMWETKAVNRLKTAVYLVLFLSAIGSAVAMFCLVQQEKTQDYKSNFYSLAEIVAMDVDVKIRGVVSQLQSTSSSITSQSMAINDKKATVPQFDRRMDDFVNTTELIMYAPLILENEKNDWETYSVREQGWIDEALLNRGWTAETTAIPETIQCLNGSIFQDRFAPVWQMSPVPRDRSIINTDLYSHPDLAAILKIFEEPNSNQAEMSGIVDATVFLNFVPDATDSDGPTSTLAVPVYQDFTANASIVGFVVGIFSWDVILDVPFEKDDYRIAIDVKNSCGPDFSYQVNKDAVTYMGTDHASSPDLQDEYPLFDSCDYSLTLGTTDEFLEAYESAAPLVSAVLVFVLFAFIMTVFFVYDFIVQQRQKKLLMTAQRTDAVVSSLFPEDVQRRIMADAEEKEKKEQRMTVTNKMKEFLQDTTQPTSKGAKAAELRGKPIADFFPEATVMFANLVGFTAWSSMREPTQVFTFLESIYNAFDEIARRRSVFKVETVGDRYLGVSGLPYPCVDHALVMARFASDCRIRMNDLVKELEVTLGPDTTELAMRFGLHSGPVTAGVLRGDKARFQLFGDTINTTSRIESTGKRDQIHISQETAEYLITAGKQHWLKLREDKVTAKGKQDGNTLFRPIKGFFSILPLLFSGKGELTTYWLAINKLRSGGKALSTSFRASELSNSYNEINKSQMNLMASKSSEQEEQLTEKQRRLVNWITNELAEILRQLEVSRIGRPEPKSLVDLEQLSVSRKHGKNPLDEVEEIITLPKYSAASHEFADELERENFMLPKYVIDELRSYVSLLAGMYLENPFHNFEHARYVHLLLHVSIVVLFEIS
jgi:class 3 adenylate cyclase